jgi:RNA polymerase sigma factor (sigma-70 family)
MSDGIGRRDTVSPYPPTQRGDEAELFERHGDELVRIVQRALGVHRHIAEDACSFAWLQLLRLQPERERVVGWLRVVAINEALRLLRGRARHAMFEEDSAEPSPMEVDVRTDLALTVEVREALEQVADLTPQQVRIFSLHLAGLTYGEISRQTGYSCRTVERHVFRARSKLREQRT